MEKVLWLVGQGKGKYRELLLWTAFCIVLIWFAAVPFPATGQAYGESNALSRFLVWFGLIASGLTFLYFLFLAVLAYLYKPFAIPDSAQLPGCTVIVPAYNEGRHVAETLYSLMDCDYPAEKLEIIAINDGSKDDTWEWIQKAASRSNGMIKSVNLIKNGGKKHALYQGILSAKHEIIVTVDSDSIVEKDALKQLAAPFQRPDVGGVAGNIRIKNLDEGAFPLMMDICFAFGFEFIRCAQSIIGSVLCTPGALSAYRRSMIMPCLDEWLNQTFLGAPSHIGEDRAITSMILRDGNKVVFQSTAIAHTCTPSTYSKLCRMLIRWTRSDIRENLVMSKYALKQISFTNFAKIGLQINVIAQILSIFLPFFFLPSMLYFFFAYPENWGSMCYLTLMTIFLWSLIPAVIYSRRYSFVNSIWAFAYGIFNLFGLSWICIYSFFTMKNSNWLTRELPQKHLSVLK